MKRDAKVACLAMIARDPGPPCEVTVFFRAKRDVKHITRYLADEWEVRTVALFDDRLTFREAGTKATAVLTDLRHKFRWRFVSGWQQPVK